MNSINDLFTRPHKSIQIYYGLSLEMARSACQVLLCVQNFSALCVVHANYTQFTAT